MLRSVYFAWLMVSVLLAACGCGDRSTRLTQAATVYQAQLSALERLEKKLAEGQKHFEVVDRAIVEESEKAAQRMRDLGVSRSEAETEMLGWIQKGRERFRASPEHKELLQTLEKIKKDVEAQRERVRKAKAEMDALQ